jgi:DNA repair exonuclease SbcCD ATPase subunit
MLISQIILKDFGKFENLTCDFSPGLNLIKGPNEAGKSTLAEAVTAAIFADPAKEKDKLSGAVRWGETRGPVLEAVFDIEGTSYKMKKDFGEGSVKVDDGKSGAVPVETGKFGTMVSDLLGMPSQEIFRATACINQGEVCHIDESIEAIKDKLESLATGGKEEQAASRTIQKISDRILQIAGEDGDSGGEIGRINKLIGELDYNIEKIERDIATLKKKRADLIQLETAYSNVKEDLSSKKELCKRAAKYRETVEKVSQLETEHQELQKRIRQARELSERLTSLQSKRTQVKKVNIEELEELEQIQSSLSHLSPKCADVEEEASEAKSDLDGYGVGAFSILLTAIGLAGGGFLGVAYFQGFLHLIYPYFWHAVGGAAGFTVIGLSMIVSRKQHQSYLKKRYNKLAKKHEGLSEEVTSKKNKLSEALTRHSVISVEDLKKHRWQYEENEKQIENEMARYNEILSGKTLSELEKQLTDQNGQMEGLVNEKNNLGNYSGEDLDLDRQKLIIDQIEERIKDLEKERTVLIHQIETAEGGAELLASYSERRDKMRARLDAMKKEIEILKLTAECIEAARQNILTSKLEVLNNKTSRYLEGLTSGRYSKVRFDDSSLKFEVWSGEREAWLDPEKSLSAGTVEQIYLAARLALADLVSEERNSILIFDDPFAGYDQARLENAMNMLKDLSANHQIFLLTSQDHYDRWADSTIVL